MTDVFSNASRQWIAPSTRRLQHELMDDPALDAGRHAAALDGLARINCLSASARMVWRPIRKLAQRTGGRTLRVLDLATGSGDIPIALWKRSVRHGLPLEIHGMDISQRAVDRARRRAAANDSPVRFHTLDVIHDELPDDFDVVTCSLFLHHLTDDQTLFVLKKMARAARRLVLVNDLQRCTTGLLLAHLASRLLTTSDVVRADAVLSVCAAFTLGEVRQLARKAGLNQPRVQRRWPCRFLLTSLKGH